MFANQPTCLLISGLLACAVRAIVGRLIKEIPKQQLTIGAQVGHGHFAVCKLADYAAPGHPVQKVVFKESKATPKEIIDEISTFDKMPTHKNVLKFLGVCWDPLGFVVPFMAGGSVEDAVKAEVRAGRQSKQLISQPKIVSFCVCSVQGAEAAAAYRS